MRKVGQIGLALFCLASVSFGQAGASAAAPETAPSAANVLKETFTKAKREKKVAMIIFHASW